MTMASTVRKRTWTTSKGENKTARVVNYPDRSGKWRQKTFATKKAANAYLLQAQGEVRGGIHIYHKDSVTVAEAGRSMAQDRGRQWARARHLEEDDLPPPVHDPVFGEIPFGRGDASGGRDVAR
jgi:hypothetical protein